MLPVRDSASNAGDPSRRHFLQFIWMMHYASQKLQELLAHLFLLRLVMPLADSSSIPAIPLEFCL